MAALWRRRLSWVVGTALIVVALSVALAIWFRPALTMTMALTWRRADPWLARLQDAVVVEELSIAAGDRRVPADLYRTSAPGGAIVLVHGLSPLGRRHPDIVRIARLLARHHRLVLVPQIEGLATFRMSGAGDTSVPFTESLRLAAAAGRTEAVILESFTHIITPPFWSSLGSRVRDGGRLLQVFDALLSDRLDNPRITEPS